MKETDLCPCCSGKTYFNCCQLVHQDHSKATTAEALMRSRYSAFALRNADYLMLTTHSSQQKYHSKEEYLAWATQNTWLKLEVVSALPEIVEFKAWYRNSKGEMFVHHERSTFLKEKDLWFYVDGIFME